MSRPSVSFLLYLLGMRRPHTTLTDAETTLLIQLTQGRRCVAEIGVYEGVTSARLAAALDPSGLMLLIDPYELGTRPERLLGISYSRHIAGRLLRPWRSRIRFVRQTSEEALRDLDPELRVDLAFIDADHRYEAVHADFLGWKERLCAGGVIVLHDSRRCGARPDLDESTGPVRLAAEIRSGHFGPWRCCAEADSVTAFRFAGIES